jgi:hypothetical protein
MTTEDKVLVSSARASWLVKHITAKGMAAYFFNIRALCKSMFRKGMPVRQSPLVYANQDFSPNDQMQRPARVT